VRISVPRAGWPEIAQVGRDLPGDVRVVVLMVDGGSAASGSVVLEPRTVDDARARVLGWLRRPDLVSVAVLRAAPDAAALAMALACDLRVATEGVVVGAAAVVEPGVVTALTELTGRGVAASMLLAGRTLTAAEALQVGLVERVVADGELDAELNSLVATLTAVPRDAAAELKSLLLRATPGSPTSFAAEVEALARISIGPELGAG
jgi:enoyl-CoA hydratase/carnithine racemase